MIATLSPLFKLAFFTLLALTLIFFLAGVGYSVMVPNPTETQASAGDKLFETGSYTLTALIGLLVGKVA